MEYIETGKLPPDTTVKGSYILPILTFFIVPLYNDSNWGWLLASNPETNYLIIASIVSLIAIGIIKTIIYFWIRYKKCHE